ncbi:MAG: CoA ester lyase [Candidatus Aminicenantes bacterium]|nr:MAG: CoA ester lyase [Candidatus Aminicenantes bacterium]
MLFVPGGNEKLLSKGLGLDVDAIIIDLEDSVAPQMKKEARMQVAEALNKEGFRDKEKVVRVNSLKTDFGYDDLTIMSESQADTLLIPKVDGPDDIKKVDSIISKGEKEGGTFHGNIELIALIESPMGILYADQIAFCNPRLTGLLFGAGDFVRETRGRITPDRKELYYPLSRMLLAARAANIDAIDSPYFNIKDPQGLEQHTMQARLLGYDGKAIIHPNQVEIVNRIFTPDDDEISLARRIIGAHEKAKAEGKGATTVDGELVENVHAVIAQRTLSIARKTGKI